MSATQMKRIEVPQDPRPGEVQLIDNVEQLMALGIRPTPGLIVVRMGRQSTRKPVKTFYSNTGELISLAAAISANKMVQAARGAKPVTSGTRRAAGSGRAAQGAKKTTESAA